MKTKVFVLAAVLIIAILSFSVVSPVFAVAPLSSGSGNGGGGNGNQGATGTGTGVPVEQSINLDGALNDLLHANLVAALGIRTEDLTARLDAGETFSAIALSLGFDSAEISDMLVQARADAFAQAVAEGLITQEVADWLASRGNQTPAASYGDGICDDTGDCVAEGTYQSTMTKNGNRKGYGS